MALWSAPVACGGLNVADGPIFTQISTQWFTANALIGCYVTVPFTMKATGLAYIVITQSGNVSVALYKGDGSAQLATSGSVACPAPFRVQTNFTTPVVIGPGVYFIALAVDNTTMQSQFQTLGGFKGATTVSSSFPCPSTVTVTAGAGSVPVMSLVGA